MQCGSTPFSHCWLMAWITAFLWWRFGPMRYKQDWQYCLKVRLSSTSLITKQTSIVWGLMLNFCFLLSISSPHHRRYIFSPIFLSLVPVFRSIIKFLQQINLLPKHKRQAILLKSWCSIFISYQHRKKCQDPAIFVLEKKISPLIRLHFYHLVIAQ